MSEVTSSPLHNRINPQRRRLFILAYAAILILSTFALLEISLRYLDPIGISYFFDADRYFASMQPNQDFSYIHKPGKSITLNGHTANINSHGLRGAEFTKAPPPNQTRILILGDSVVFGWGVAEDATFPVKVAEMLRACQAPAEIIAAGVGSWNTRTEFEFLRARGMDFNPDFVLLVIVSNDLEPKWNIRHGLFGSEHRDLKTGDAQQFPTRPGLHVRAWSKLNRLLGSHSYLCRHIQYFLRRNDLKDAHTAITETSKEWMDASDALDSMISLCTERNVTFIPCLYSTQSEVSTDSVLRLFDKHLRNRGFEPWYIGGADIHGNPAMRNSRVDVHANAAGHRLIAGQIYTRLLPLLGNPYESAPKPAMADKKIQTQN